jgi:hypothetical protein
MDAAPGPQAPSPLSGEASSSSSTWSRRPQPWLGPSSSRPEWSVQGQFAAAAGRAGPWAAPRPSTSEASRARRSRFARTSLQRLWRSRRPMIAGDLNRRSCSPRSRCLHSTDMNRGWGEWIPSTPARALRSSHSGHSWCTQWRGSASTSWSTRRASIIGQPERSTSRPLGPRRRVARGRVNTSRRSPRSSTLARSGSGGRTRPGPVADSSADTRAMPLMMNSDEPGGP